VYPLQLDMINLIFAAEEDSRQARIFAQQNAQELIDEADRSGREKVASTLARAEAEIAHMTRLSDQKATQYAMELASTTANRKATLHARAERRLDSASQYIVERIETYDSGR